MRLSTKIMTLTLCLFALTIVTRSQSVPSNSIEDSIESKIKQQYGVAYNAISIIEIQKEIRKPVNKEKPMKDIYRTLSESYLIIATGLADSNLDRPKGFIGISKEGEIAWRSEDLIEDFSNVACGISAIDDINNDGLIEILISQYSGSHGEVEHLWIFSWDGKRGKLISNRDEEGESVIATDYGFHFVDINGDGIKEIQGRWIENEDSEKSTKVTYSWNGELYGRWEKIMKFSRQRNSK